MIEHAWRTRTDPFEAHWEEVCEKLVESPGLEAKTPGAAIRRPPSPLVETVGYESYLLELAEREREARHNARIARRLKDAKLPLEKILKAFHY